MKDPKLEKKGYKNIKITGLKKQNIQKMKTTNKKSTAILLIYYSSYSYK